MPHALTSLYRGYHEELETHEVPVGEIGSVHEPHKELMTYLLYHTRTTLEGLAVSCGRWGNYKRWSDKEAREALQPAVQALAWLSEPVRSGSPWITLDQCCEYLNLDTDQVRELMVGLFRKVPLKGVLAVRWYIDRLLSDPAFARVHYNGSPPMPSVRGKRT